MLTTSNSIIGLDVGGRRIGVAAANAVARIAHPLTTLQNDDGLWDDMLQLLQGQDAAVIVVGLPRGLNGQHTAQTTEVEAFTEELKRRVMQPVYWQDEAVTSRKAEAELQARGKKYQKGDIDALAATYILEDFLTDHPEITA